MDRKTPTEKEIEKAFEKLSCALERLKVKRGANAIYTLVAILYVVVFSGSNQKTLRRGTKKLRREDIKIPVLSTVTRCLKQIEYGDTQHWFYENVGKSFKNVRKRYNLRKPVTIAIDIRDFSRQKPRKKRGRKKKRRMIEDFSKVVRCKSKNGTNNAFRFAVSKVIDKGVDFVCSMEPVFKKASKALLLSKVLENTMEVVGKIRLCLVDGGFFNGEYIQVLNSSDIHWVMSACWNRKVKRIVKQVKKDGKEWFVTPYIMNQGKWNEARFHLVVVKKPKSIKKKSGKLSDEYFVYATDINVNSRTMAFYLSELYRARWGIETSNWVVNEFRAKTRSTYYNVRFITIILGVSMYNVWILLRAILSAYDEYIEGEDLREEISDIIIASFLVEATN